jgi:serine/threonine protein kinase
MCVAMLYRSSLAEVIPFISLRRFLILSPTCFRRRCRSGTLILPYSEINLGRMVGEGGFCRVTEISSVDLDEVYDTSDEDAALRRGFAREVNDPGSGGGGLIPEGTGRGGGGKSFVLKTLRGDLPDDELEKGIVDLAIEAEFLAVLSHPNVIAMRAMANSDPHSGRFFVVLDRLTQTLDKKFNYWRKIVGDNAGYWFPLVGYCCAKTPTLHAIWKERMAAVLNIALAIQYLHSLGIVYRDLKPDNIGFDFSGGLKVSIRSLANTQHSCTFSLCSNYWPFLLDF